MGYSFLISIQYVHYLFKRNLEHRYFFHIMIWIDISILMFLLTLLGLINSIGILKKFMGIRLHVFPCYDCSCMIQMENIDKI